MNKSARRKKTLGDAVVTGAISELRSVVKALNETVGENARTLANTVAEVGRLGNRNALSTSPTSGDCDKPSDAKNDLRAGQSARVSQNPPVLIELDRQQRAIEVLHERLSALDEKLDPALIPMPPPATSAGSPCGTSPASAGMSRVANMICSRTDMLEAAVARVQRLIERVEV